MTTKPGSFAATPAISPGASDLATEPSSAPLPGAEDFSNVMSQTFYGLRNSSVLQNSGPNVEDARRRDYQNPDYSNPSQDASASSQTSSDFVPATDSRYQHSTNKTDDNRDGQSKSSDDQSNNSSAASAMMLLTNPFAAPTADVRQVVVPQGTSDATTINADKSGRPLNFRAEQGGDAANAAALKAKAAEAKDAKPSADSLQSTDTKPSTKPDASQKNIPLVPVLPTDPDERYSGLRAHGSALKQEAARASVETSAEITALQKKLEAESDTAKGHLLQPVVAGLSSAQLMAHSGKAQPDGTTAALNNQRMKNTGEKNEIAGVTLQKLPRETSAADDSAPVAPLSALDSEASGKNGKDSFDSTLTMNLVGKTAPLDFNQTQAAATVQSADRSAQVERLTHLVSNEIATLRQTGASEMAVSLKLDSRTELFLQLSNHNGQMQASIRLERGNANGLGEHWGELQQSLARQNVQLQPLEVRATANTASFNHSAPHNPQRQAKEFPQDEQAATPTRNAATTRKSKTKTGSRSGWESWA